MAHKCYISFKTEDIAFKEAIQRDLPVDMIDKSLDEPIDSTHEDYILRKIREDYLADSTVTIHLIGQYSAENRGQHEQRFIKRELQASLYDSATNSRSGILGVVLPGMSDAVYGGSYICSTCVNSHKHVAINDRTAIREFSYNYYLPNKKCAHWEDDRYCVLVPWGDFTERPIQYIDKAFAKRGHPISRKVKIYGL